MGDANGFEYDLITIGAGSGGVRASRISAQNYGAKVAIVELPFGFVSSEHVGGAGGTCVIRGCVPKKLLVYGSSFRGEFDDAEGFGWEVPKIDKHDWKKLIDRKAKEIVRLNSVYMKLLKDAGVHFEEGRGKLIDAHTVEVDLAAGGTKRMTAKHILLATGGSPVVAPIPGSEYAITSDHALTLDHFPEKAIVIVGGGYIALEFAGIFRGIGADVHLFFRKPLPLTGFDGECRQQMLENLRGRGINVYVNTSPTRVDKNGNGSYTVAYEGDCNGSVECNTIMFGTGRKANTQGLNLEAVGIEVDKAGAVKVDKFSRTTVPSIWAIGDVTNRLNLTPVAIMEGMAFAESCFGKQLRPPVYEKVPSAVFTQPPLGTVGMTEEQAKVSVDGPVDVYVSKFKPMKNTLSGRDEKTFMKMLVHVSTDEVIGVHLVGPDAAEIIQGVAIALKCNARKTQFDATVGVHPSAAEELVTMRSRARRIDCTMVKTVADNNRS